MTDIDSRPREPRPAWRTIISLLLLSASVAIWIPAGNVPRLIITQDAVLLGRYPLEHFSMLFFATPALWLAAWLFWRDRWATREAKFKAIALTAGIVIAVAGADILGRVVRSPRYVEESVQEWTRWPGERVDGPVRSRPPNMTYLVTYDDAPPHARSYPDAPAGFGVVECTLETDARGFRNAEALQRADIVVIGDSFAEGSRVDTDESWPMLMQESLGRSVYCLAISGGRPSSYVSNFLVHGRELRPRIAVIMLYEGNDFDAAGERGEPSFNDRVNGMIKSSPIIGGLRRAFVRFFAGVNADRPVDHPALEFMPLEVTAGGATMHVTFPPKRVRPFMKSSQEFAQSRGWRNTADSLRQLFKACSEAGVQPVVTLAPSAPRMLLPVVRDQITPQQLHAFLSIDERGLPSPEECFERVYAGLDVPEQAVESFCAEQGVQFVSITESLRERTRAGEQVYYTYDQHWTRLGHDAAAEVIGAALQSMLEEDDDDERADGTS